MNRKMNRNDWAEEMYLQADLTRLGYIAVSEEHNWEKGEDTLTKTIYTVPTNKANGPSTAKEFMVKFLKGSAAVIAVTLDHEHVQFRPYEPSPKRDAHGKIDISSLETNTQKIERLEREVQDLRAFGKKYCKHLPNCCSTSKGCHCEMSQEMKRLGIGGKVGGKACTRDR